MGNFEDRKAEFFRKGALDKARWLEKIEKTIIPSHMKRIRENDKTVLKEIVLPSWVDWELLQEYAASKNVAKTKTCVFCSQEAPNGIFFSEKFICENCFLKLKNQ